MRFTLLGAVGVGVVMVALPAYAQITDAQVGRVVEAIRQASKPNQPTPGLYSDWQVKPENVSRWSKSCLNREVSPAEFQVNRTASRAVVTCVLRDVLKQEYQASKNNEVLAVQRVAAWWLTGNGDRYNSAEAAPYVQKVLGFYQGATSTAAKPAATATIPPTQPAQGKPTSFYDRYMQAGYAAMQKKETAIAALYFKRALDERPQDRFALQAIQNVEALRKAPRSTPAAEKPAPVKR